MNLFYFYPCSTDRKEDYFLEQSIGDDIFFLKFFPQYSGLVKLPDGVQLTKSFPTVHPLGTPREIPARSF